MPLSSSKKQPVWVSWLFVLILLTEIALLWALFIRGPVRIHQERVDQALERISEQVPEIQGVEENHFQYITYQGYTSSTLYWFDEAGEILTTRDLATLNYEQARLIAREEYGLQADTIFLAFGYSHPVYGIEENGALLYLNYDDFQTVYYRGGEQNGL